LEPTSFVGGSTANPLCRFRFGIGMSESQYWLMFQQGRYLVALGATSLVLYLAVKRWSPETLRASSSSPALAILGFVVFPLGLIFMVIGVFGVKVLIE
jgi:hypothetical protein